MKLTDQDVLNIRNARNDGDGVTMLATKYQVTNSTILKIVRGIRRAEVGGPIQPRNAAWPATKPTGQKLTDHDVVTIRLKAQHGARTKDLAAEYKVSPPCIADILNGRTRRNLPGPRRDRPRLSPAQITAIREEYANGTATRNAMARRYGVNPMTIANIAHGTTHKDVPGPITRRTTHGKAM